MRVGLIAPPWNMVPPVGPGGTEAVVDNLARGLRARGHDVRLFTVGTSTCPVRREYLFDEPARPMGQSLAETAHVLAAYETLADADVIHDHTLLGALVAFRAGLSLPPVVVTNHGTFDELSRPLFREIAKVATVVAISADQAGHADGIPIGAVIHHGIDLEAYRPGPREGDHLVFIGRMSPDKGVDRAVRIARAAERPLRMVSRITEPAERAYFEGVVRPLLHGAEEMPVELGLEERVELLGSAAGLLNPISWSEPFGLVMAEALACGTPVLATPRGAAREIVVDGRTGYLRRSETSMAHVVPRLDWLDRDDCRRDAERRFSSARMVREHERLYTDLIANGSRPAVNRRVSGVPSLPVQRASRDGRKTAARAVSAE